MDGQILKERLPKLTDLTQMELAEKLNVSQQSFSQYFLAKDVKSGLLERLQFYAARHSWATIARNDLHIGKDTINEALNHVDSTMAVTDTYIRKSFGNLNEANRLVVGYIVGLKLA